MTKNDDPSEHIFVHLILKDFKGYILDILNHGKSYKEEILEAG